MTIETRLGSFLLEGVINAEIIAAIQNDNALRKDLIHYLRQNPNRKFALALLNEFIRLRKLPKEILPAEDLMFACYILGVHNQIEDCLKIWEAKNADFDTYCGLDVQLIAFAGVEETIVFLKGEAGVESDEALEYISECMAAGDLNHLDTYFSVETLPWFV